MTLDGVGAALRTAGLTAARLEAWAGTARLSRLGRELERLRASEVTPASTALALFVAGVDVAIDRAARLPLEAMEAAGLIERSAERVRALVSVLPLGEALLVCDRADAPASPELVCWPDDSSYHLAGAVPRAAGRWLDLGCGSAFAQLARPRVSAVRWGSDLNPRAIEYARLGSALSRIPIDLETGDASRIVHVHVHDLVTLNCPIPSAFRDAGNRLPMWRTTGHGFFDDLFASLPQRLVEAPTSLIILHARRDMLTRDLPGERTLVTYTPPGLLPAFAVLGWRPFAPPRFLDLHRPLTVDRPHIDGDDLDLAPLP